jgi:hypothetical protein
MAEQAVVAPPVAAPSAAPSTPAPAAPVTPVETTSAPVSTEPAAPVTESAAPAAKPEPKQSDFPNPEAFLRAHYEWEDQQTGETVEEPVVEPEAPATEEVATEEKPAEEVKETVELPEPEESLTPESLSTLEKETPELKALFDANPEVKGTFYKMARENAKLKPMGEIFPTVESAQFANETANKMVGMRTAFTLAAEDPAKINDAFNMFVDEFRVVDKDGKPVMDEQGNPKLGEDFEVLVNHVVGNYFEGELADIEARLSADKYGSPIAKENDEVLLQAYKLIQASKDASLEDMSRPDLSGVPDEVRKHYEAKEAEIKRREEELKGQQNQKTAEGRKAAREQHETTFRQKYGSEVGKRLADYLNDKITKGVYIPPYVLQTVDPQTKVSVFAKQVFDKFQKKIQGVAHIMQQSAQLQMLAPSEENLNQRLTFHRNLIDTYLPEIIDAEIRLIQGKEKQARDQRSTQRAAAEKVAVVEPRGGSAPRPTVLNDEQAFAQAKVNVDKKYEGKFIDQRERTTQYLIEKNRLLGGR